MLSPLPPAQRLGVLLRSFTPSRVSLPRKGCRVGLRIVLFEACSAFTRVTACTLALSPIRDTLSEGFSYFVTSIAAPAASGWSGRRVGLAPTGKRRLATAHTHRRLPLGWQVAGSWSCNSAHSRFHSLRHLAAARHLHFRVMAHQNYY